MDFLNFTSVMNDGGGLFSALLLLFGLTRTYADAPDWWRMYHEIILEGKETSEDDTPAQAAHRAAILKSVQAVRDTGGVCEPLKE